MEEILLMTIEDCEDVLADFTRHVYVLDGLRAFRVLSQGGHSHHLCYTINYTDLSCYHWREHPTVALILSLSLLERPY